MQPYVFQTDHLTFADFLCYPDLAIPEGKTTFVSGPSGCGKSTLFHLLNATRNPSGGRIFYRGNSIAEMDPLLLRRQVLLAGQDVFVFDGTIGDNFKEFYTYRGWEIPTQERMGEMLRCCALDFSPDHPVGGLSGGEKQRLYCSIYLSFVPDVLLLDEPTSALDADTAKVMLTNLLDFCKKNGTTPVIISHDRGLAASFSECTIELERTVG